MEVIHTGRGGVPLLQLLDRSDFVSLHCPLTAETHHLIDAAALDAMKPTAILINTARGPIVDPVALREALIVGADRRRGARRHRPRAAARRRPAAHGAQPDRRAPHRLGDARRRATRMADLAVDNLLAALAGEPMPHEVTLMRRARSPVVDIGSNSTRLLIAEVERRPGHRRSSSAAAR